VQQLNDRLQRVLLHRVVDRSRYENFTLRTILTQWRHSHRAIVGLVRTSGLFTARSREERRAGLGLIWPDRRVQLAQLLDTIAGVLGAMGLHAMTTLQRDLPALVELEVRELPQQVNRELNQVAAQLAEGQVLLEAEGAVFNAVPLAQVTELLGTPLGGAHFATSFGDLSTTVLMRLRNTLLTGLMQGQGVPSVARGVSGVLENTRWQAERIVRSEFGRVANQAALTQFEANAHLLRGVRWVATLDQRTCLQCSNLDRQVWADAARAKVPVVDTHPNCRCTLIPVVKGLPGVTLPPGQRSALEGEVPATLTYNAWFGEQSPKLQREILGPTRYSLWSQGKVGLPDFVSARGVRSVHDVLQGLKRS
jgi:SPP1 gp7 family putative phage head morphogenesis protein